MREKAGGRMRNQIVYDPPSGPLSRRRGHIASSLLELTSR